jgi:hypothetical protein
MSPLRSWLVSTFLPSLIPIAVIGIMIISTMITIGETPSGPAADLSAYHHGLNGPTSLSFSTGHDPYTIASRVDHGQLVEVER